MIRTKEYLPCLLDWLCTFRLRRQKLSAHVLSDSDRISNRSYTICEPSDFRDLPYRTCFSAILFLALFGSWLTHARAQVKNSVQLCNWLASAVYDYKRSHTPIADSILMGESKANSDAEKACRQALKDDPENLQVQFQLARVLILAGQSTEGELLATAAADSGYTAASFLIGKAYYQGWLGKPDMSKAVKWLSLAAEDGNQDAQLMLGTLYRYGHGVEIDLEKAHKLLREAATQGNAKAQYLLGMMYYQGVAVGRDTQTAFKLIKASADQGISHAQFTAGLMYLQGVGTKKDPLSGLALLERAAENGYALAQVQLGTIYFKGEVVEANRSKSRDFYCRAGALGKERYFELTREELTCPD